MSVTSKTFTPQQPFRPTITVGREKLPIAIQHGMELWWDESTPTKRLDDRDNSSQFTRFVNARIEGKLAEVAFTQLLETYFGLRSQVDWRIYGDYTTTDNGDLQHLLDSAGNTYPLGAEFDLKKTKPWNSWLAIRQEIYNKLDDDAPVILSKLWLSDEDLQLDPWRDSESWDDVEGDDEFRDRLLEFSAEAFPLDVEFVGTAYPSEFTDEFEQGEHLYDPQSGAELGPPLKRANAGIPVSNLNAQPARWNRIVDDIVGDAPPDIWRPLPIATPAPTP